jgi:hypothetical protein
MKLQRSIGSLLAVALVVVAAMAYGAKPVMSSDHQDSPTTVNRPGADITDVFVFPSPANPNNVVLAMDVYPLIPAGQGTSTYFDPSVLYQFKIAHGSATAEDTVIQFTASGTGPGQTLTMYGPATPASTGTSNTILGNVTTTVAINQASAVLPSGIQVFAGGRSDPFYFDLFQFFKIVPDRYYKNQPQFGSPTVPAATAATLNGFANAANANSVGTTYQCSTNPAVDALSSNSFNVLSIVVEVPKTIIAPSSGSPLLNVWATTSTTSGS